MQVFFLIFLDFFVKGRFYAKPSKGFLIHRACPRRPAASGQALRSPPGYPRFFKGFITARPAHPAELWQSSRRPPPSAPDNPESPIPPRSSGFRRYEQSLRLHCCLPHKGGWFLRALLGDQLIQRRRVRLLGYAGRLPTAAKKKIPGKYRFIKSPTNSSGLLDSTAAGIFLFASASKVPGAS